MHYTEWILKNSCQLNQEAVSKIVELECTEARKEKASKRWGHVNVSGPEDCCQETVSRGR